MKITQEEVVDRQTVLHIELEDEDLSPYLDRGYRRVSQRTVIPGFRKGKAPRRIVERFLGRESLLSEVLDTMLPEVTRQAIAGQEIDAVGMPQIELLELDPFTLKATVPLTPEVDPGPYRDIRVPVEMVEVTGQDIEDHLERMQQSMASWEPVERPVQMGDLVTMNVAGTVEGRTSIDQKDTVYLVDADSTRPFAGFAEHVVAAVTGDAKDFDLTIADDHPDEAIAGKEVHFSVTVSEIKERILPVLDDEFAKGYGDGFDSLDALRQHADEDLNSTAENDSKLKYQETTIQAIIDAATVELSPVMLEHETDHMSSDQERFLGRINIRMDDYLQSIGKSEEEMRGDMREEATLRIKRTFVLSKVAELESVDVSDEEINEKVQETLAEVSEDQKPDLDEDELKSAARGVLVRQKTIDLLVAIAKGEVPALAEPADESTGQAEVEGDAVDKQA